jgi:hypothetical protein
METGGEAGRLLSASDGTADWMSGVGQVWSFRCGSCFAGWVWGVIGDVRPGWRGAIWTGVIADDFTQLDWLVAL